MRCWAYDENGRICGRPAVAVDAKRGLAVCERHQTVRRQVEALRRSLREASPGLMRYASAEDFLRAAAGESED